MWSAEFPKAGRETGSVLRVSVPIGTKSRMFAVLLALLLFGANLHGADETAVAHSDKGLQLAQAGDLAGAEHELRAAAALAPQNPEFLTSLATILAMEKRLEDSTNVFKRALKLDPQNVTARRYLAANLWQLHRYPEAKQNLELILKQNSSDQPSRLLLGMVAENMKDYGTAVRMLASVPAEVQKQPESIAALAVSYYKIGEKQKARHTLEQLQNHPTGTRAVLLAAQIADEAGDYETAEQLLTFIRSNYPDQADLDYRMAAVQYHGQKFAESEQTLLHLVEAGNRTGRILNLLGWCYQKQRQSEQAMRAFEDGITLEPNEESNYLDLERILIATNRLAAALEVAKRTTNALPNSPRVFAMRGSIEMQASQFTNAEASYRRAKELDPVGVDAALGLADAEFAAGMSKEAHAEFEAGIQQFPKDARFRLHYALALLKESETGDPLVEARAEELLKSVVKLDPSSVEAYCQLGELALRNGHIPESLRDYEAATKLDPQNGKVHFGLSKVYRRLGRTEEASREEKLFQKLQESNSAATLSSTEGTQK
jgi:Tfp pilus assembly protein PilF